MFNKKYFNSIKAIILTSCLFITNPSHAITPVVEMGAYFGGDQLAHATYVSGNTDSIDAGGLLDFSVGILMPFSDSFEAQLTIGYRFDSIEASNVTIDWERKPLEFKLFRVTEKFRIGGGITNHLDPKLEGTGVISGSAQFEDATGFVVEADYRYTDKSYIGIKYTDIDYEIGSISVDGSSVGIVLGLAFR